jgi:hypothetical protein
MSASIIPSSSIVVTRAFGPPAPALLPHVPLRSAPPPVRRECLYPGALPVLTNAPAGERFCWRCGRWWPETAFRSANDVCADCRWMPYRQQRTTRSHHKEVCDASVQ